MGLAGSGPEVRRPRTGIGPHPDSRHTADASIFPTAGGRSNEARSTAALATWLRRGPAAWRSRQQPLSAGCPAPPACYPGSTLAAAVFSGRCQRREVGMRAFAVRSFGEAAAVQDLPVPAVDGGWLVRVRFAGVNPLDSNLLGRLTAASPYPFVAGIDFAGVAERVPAGDHGLQAGDRVFGMARAHGSYAEYTAAAPGAALEPVARIPDGVTDEQAAALPIPATTALRTIDLLEVTAGQQVVVMGATGGVGGYAVQMARSRGAHVIATVRGDADEARRLGAEEVYDSQAGDVIDALRAAHPDGVDAVLDLVIRPAGRLVSTIFAADEGWFAQRQITAHNHASSANPLISPQGLVTVAQMLADGTITTRIRSTAGLDTAEQILDELRHGGLRGKAVIRL